MSKKNVKAAADLQKLLQEVPREKLALALRGVDEKIKEVFFRNLSVRTAESLRVRI